MAMPPMTRQIARSQIANGTAEPIALITNSTAASCMTRMRPIRSASPPAMAAPTAEPSSADETTSPVRPEPTWKCAWMASTPPLITDVS